MASEVVMEGTNHPNLNLENPNRKLGKTILDNFSKLVNPHDHVRATSAGNLLKYLWENSETDEGINELKYALKRLVRGLGSQSFSARTGYYITLVAVLKFLPKIALTEILELIKAELQKSRKNNDAENADICVGQILACGAIINANKWPQACLESQRELLELLLKASKERTYIRLFGYSFLIQLLKLSPQVNEDQKLALLISEEVSKSWMEQTTDTLYLLLNLRLIYPKAYTRKFIKAFLGTPDIVCKESLVKLCDILMAIPKATALKHPIYDLLVTLIPSSLLVDFFNELDNHLKTPNRNRLLAFINILTNTFAHFSKIDQHHAQIPSLITRNFVIQLLSYFRTFKGKQKDKEYQQMVQKLFITLLELFKNGSADYMAKIGVIKKFIFDPGTFVFEKVTKSKIVQQITLTLDAEGVKHLGSIYQGVTEGTEAINSENNTEAWLNNDRLYSAHLLIKLLSLPTMKEENEWKIETLKFLLNVSLIRDERKNNVGRELAESLRTAFFGALDLKLSKLEELQSILLHLVQFVDSLLSPENINVILRTPITNETYELWQKTLQSVKKIEKKHSKSSISSVFLTLFLHMSLQLFNDVKLATESLNELLSCYERVIKGKKRKRILNDKSEENSLTESGNDLYWLEVVVDLFLNLLSYNSHLLRSIMNSVFPHLCPYMNSTTLHQIVSVLDPQNDENPLSRDAESESESEDEDAESQNQEDVSEDESSANDEDMESDDANEQTINDKLRMALHEALSNGGAQSDGESIDLDQMSETEGERLDQALADVFKQFKPNHGKRRKQTKDQETLTHFRVRVLDLVEIYIDSTPSMKLSLEIMLPILQAVEFSIRDEHQKPLHDRLKHVLKKLLGLKKFSDIDGVDGDVLLDILKSILDKSGRNALVVQEMGEQISDCCIFIVKCSDILLGSENFNSKNKKQVKSSILEVLSGELYQFCAKRESLTPYVLFKRLFQLSWTGNITLAVIMLELIFSPEVRQFKKNQITELLKIIYSNQRFFNQIKNKDESNLLKAHKEFSVKCIQFFKDLCDEPDRKDIKERFICNFFDLLTAIKHCPIDHASISWAEIADVVREYRSYKTFSKDGKVAFNKLCRTLGVSNIVIMKQKDDQLTNLNGNTNNIEDGDNVDESTSKEKKKKRKRKNMKSLKDKKEAKKLRLESLSEGLGTVGFIRNIEKVNNDDDDDDDTSGGNVKEANRSSRNKNKRQLRVANGHNEVGGEQDETELRDSVEVKTSQEETCELTSKKKKKN
ncbi:myb-binding protein 1A [Euwallacea fornicatus]|uniref:myb-binding protein 1A n=1 Tax=Euwallacea fornicatus TaxID=995702 RepID=UPI00339015D8